MLSTLHLQNYRGFNDHTLDLRPLTVAVGYNNAGKSTAVEALRLLARLQERLRGLHFKEPPGWANLPRATVGLSPSLEGMGLSFETITHHYSDDPANVTATFSTGESISLMVNVDGQCFAYMNDKDGTLIGSRNHALSANFPKLLVLPQIAPLEESETILTPEYVRHNMFSTRTSLHFRNQLRLDQAAYKRFRKLAEETWPEIQVYSLVGARGALGDELGLTIRDRDYVAEVGRMGHGLQMWLQTMWFLARVEEDACVVLDEPDVYMHPDLQRRLIRFVKHKFPQVIIATHSVEIMADVDPTEILNIDRGRDRSEFADSVQAVQKLIENIGGVHNIHVARLWNARRFLLVEGKDMSFLKIVHEKLYPRASLTLDGIPNAAIGGWSGWPYAVGSSMFARNALGQKVSVYCILDSDYHTPSKIKERQEDATRRQVELHIWSRKEIENYFLNPAIIARVIQKRNPDLDVDEVSATVEAQLKLLVSELTNEVEENFLEQFRLDDPKRSAQKALRQMRDHLGDTLKEYTTSVNRVCGKKVIQMLSRWAESEYGRGFKLRDILREMTANEIPTEVSRVIRAIETRKKFPE